MDSIEFLDKITYQKINLPCDKIGMITLKNYLTLHQLERAFQDLLAGKRITEAALNAGFDSPSHFASTVKRMMGLPARSTIKDSEFLKVY